MILLEDKIYINLEHVSHPIFASIKNDLTITNPTWLQAKKLELSPWGKSQFLKFYSVEGDHLILPTGYINKLLQKFPSDQQPKVIDARFENPKKYSLHFTGKLYSFQQAACDEAMSRSFGIIQAPTGAGKTVQMIYLITQRQQPTIILVDQIELGDQFVDQLKKFTNLKDSDIGFIGNGKFSIRPITVALLQTMHRLDDRYYNIINKYIGQVFCDEVHIVAADTYYNVMSNLKAKYKFGFSATPKRVDGLTDVIFWATGPIIYKIPLEQVSIIIKPRIVRIKTDYKFPLISVREYGDMISDLSLDDARNNLIVKTVESSEFSSLQKALLCVRVIQVIELSQKIPDSDILISNISKEDRQYFIKKLGEEQAKIIFSKSSKAHRKQVIQDLHSGKLKTVISTYGLFSKGIDIQNLQLLAFCAPIRSEIIVKQCRGRVMRRAGEEVPIILDFEDHCVELLKWQARDRYNHLLNYT